MTKPSPETDLLLVVDNRRCVACKHGEHVPCDGWVSVVDTAASEWYGETRIRRVRCDFYLKRYAQECSERIASECGLPSSYTHVTNPQIDKQLVDIAGLVVVYPTEFTPQAVYHVSQTIQQAAWYHAMTGHQPSYTLVPGLEFDALPALRQRLESAAVAFFDRWDGMAHPGVVGELCAMVERRLAEDGALVLSLLQPLANLKSRVPDEAVVIYRLQNEARRVAIRSRTPSEVEQ